MCRRQLLHAFEFLQSTLCLLGLGGLVAKTADEGVDFFYASLLLFKGSLIVGQTLCTQCFKGTSARRVVNIRYLADEGAIRRKLSLSLCVVPENASQKRSRKAV